mgnify:CR=1 FL=1
MRLRANGCGSPPSEARAKAARYAAPTVQDIPSALRGRYLERVSEDGQVNFQVSPEVTQLVSFARLNLMGDWPMRGQFDLILCRNVMIYFNDDTRPTLGGEDVVDEPAADQAMVSRERTRQLADAVAALPPQMGRAFRLNKLEGRTQAETAEAMGVSRKMVEQHIQAALKALTRRLAS